MQELFFFDKLFFCCYNYCNKLNIICFIYNKVMVVSVNIEKFVLDEVLKYPVGEPIFVRDIIAFIVDKTGFPFNKVKFNVNVAMGRLLMGGKVLIKRFRNGIYYRYERCVFGDTVIHKESLLLKKYVDGFKGYEVGPRLLHCLGLTTMLSNLPRSFVSNVAFRRSFVDKDLNVVVLKPKVTLNAQNFRYFQLLDVIKLVNEVLIDNPKPLNVYKKFFDYYHLEYGFLFYYAVKFYDNFVVGVICSLFEMSKGGELYVSS